MPDPTSHRPPVPLSTLPAGSRARVRERRMTGDDCEMLNAMGLTERCALRVCRDGEPCIVQISSMRLGLSAAMARCILVDLETPPTAPSEDG